MNPGPEFLEVEQSFIDRFVAMGWQHKPVSPVDPSCAVPVRLLAAAEDF